ncbi:response regulator [Deltaproteobacteria bacterium TL4]
MKPSKILIVEDEYIVAESLKNKLENLGYEVVDLVNSGEDAINSTDQLKPNLILMDIMLEGSMDGVEAAEIIHKTHDIPIVFLTAYSDESTLQRAKVTEPFGYIIKPFKERELHSTIEISLYKYRIDQKVKKSEQWLTSILNNIGDAVITVDTLKRITYMSSIAQALTGWSLQESNGMPIFPLIQTKEAFPTPLFEEMTQRALQGETISCLVDQVVTLLSKEHQEIPIDVGVAPMRDGEKIIGAVLTLKDITQRKQMEKQLEEAQQMLSCSLTPREKEILQMMVDGATTKEIGYDLNISPRTVEAHRRNLMQKLDVSDIAMLIRSAIIHKLVDLH